MTVGTRTTIAGHPAVLSSVPVGGRALALYTVPELERLVDRDALLRGEAEPPYWAYLWAGAITLAAYVDRWVETRGRRVLEVGCGLGLPGLVAARGGGDVLFVDRARPALAFVGASAAANGLACERLCADFHALGGGARFDLILAAEIAYDRDGFAALADVFERHLRPGGIGLLADGFRTDTRPLYVELARRGTVTRAIEVTVREEGRPCRLRLTELRQGS